MAQLRELSLGREQGPRHQDGAAADVVNALVNPTDDAVGALHGSSDSGRLRSLRQAPASAGGADAATAAHRLLPLAAVATRGPPLPATTAQNILLQRRRVPGTQGGAPRTKGCVRNSWDAASHVRYDITYSFQPMSIGSVVFTSRYELSALHGTHILLLPL
jgi:hypothetical protein